MDLFFAARMSDKSNPCEPEATRNDKQRQGDDYCDCVFVMHGWSFDSCSGTAAAPLFLRVPGNVTGFPAAKPPFGGQWSFCALRARCESASNSSRIVARANSAINSPCRCVPVLRKIDLSLLRAVS